MCLDLKMTCQPESNNAFDDHGQKYLQKAENVAGIY